MRRRDCQSACSLERLVKFVFDLDENYFKGSFDEDTANLHRWTVLSFLSLVAKQSSVTNLANTQRNQSDIWRPTSRQAWLVASGMVWIRDWALCELEAGTRIRSICERYF